MLANKYMGQFLQILDTLDSKGDKVPGLIISHAGFGKTSTVRKYCEYKDYNLITLIPSMYSSDDILGLQTVVDGKLKRLTPSWYNRMLSTIEANQKRTLLFIDEITTCDPYIQGPLLDLIFNGNLGEETLPNNVFIVAAGNYSKDLNYTFKMSAPLVNRFILLNLVNEDFSVDEILDNSFKEVKDLKEFLGLEEADSPLYSFDRFKDWIRNSDEVDFGYTEYSEDEKAGLLGFTSVRSLNNVLKFTEEYLSRFKSNIWMRIAGDTLGKSEKRQGKLMHSIIKSFKKEFEIDSALEDTVGIFLDNLHKDMTDLLRCTDSLNSKFTEDIKQVYNVKLYSLVNFFENNQVSSLSLKQISQLKEILGLFEDVNSKVFKEALYKESIDKLHNFIENSDMEDF